MRFSSGYFLHDVQEVDGGEEVSEGEGGYWPSGSGSTWITQLIDFRKGCRTFARMRW